MELCDVNIHNVELAHVAGAASQHLKGGKPQFAFSGRSNVGKSSLVNSLMCRKKLARVSGEPGKTITVNYYFVDKKFYLVDLPGYGFARRPKQDKERWSAMTQAYFEGNTALRTVIQLIDCKVGITQDDSDMLEWMNYEDIPYIIVCTKCDKLNKTQLAESADKIIRSKLIRAGTDIILYSSAKGMGREALLHRIIQDASDNQ